jgi:hypothetical protein
MSVGAMEWLQLHILRVSFVPPAPLPRKESEGDMKARGLPKLLPNDGNFSCAALANWRIEFRHGLIVREWTVFTVDSCWLGGRSTVYSFPV